MIKKMKHFGIVFSLTVLIPFNLTAISCTKKTVGFNTNTNGSVNGNAKQEISSDIKQFIKTNFSSSSQQSILVIDELLEGQNFDKATKLTETKTIINDLDQLVTDLNNNASENKIELTNTIVMEGLKNKILENCNNLDKELKKPDGEFSAEFQQVKGKILNIEEDSLIFSLKKFSINQLLSDIQGESLDFDIQQDPKIANSKNLKIYNFSTQLDININKDDGKKDLIPIKDLNLFVVLDKSQAQMLTEGITNYLQKRFERTATDIYLDGSYLEGKGNAKVNEYLKAILKQPNNYDLTNQDNKNAIMYYLSNVYLPGLIYKDYNPNEEKPVKIVSKNLIINPENLNIHHDGMKMDDDLQKEINFLNFFGKQQQRQISPQTVDKISIEHFLKDPNVYFQKYYFLGSGTLKVNNWNIRGFSINPININFKIYIMKQILETEITNLKIFLNNLLDVMNESAITKRNDSGKIQTQYGKYVATNGNNPSYTVDIVAPSSVGIYEKIKTKYGDKAFFDDILNELYVEKAISKSKINFESIEEGISCKFSSKTSNNKNFTFWPYPFKNKKRFEYHSLIKNDIPNQTFDIYFVFNFSFKIKLNDEFFVEKRLAKRWEGETITDQLIGDGHRIIFN